MASIFATGPLATVTLILWGELALCQKIKNLKFTYQGCRTVGIPTYFHKRL